MSRKREQIKKNAKMFSNMSKVKLVTPDDIEDRDKQEKEELKKQLKFTKIMHEKLEKSVK
jgi:hypothetical protein